MRGLFLLWWVRCVFGGVLREDEYDLGGAKLAHLGESIYGVPSEETGKRVAELADKDPSVNPEELGDYAEADILFPASLGRNGLVAEAARWRGGVVPYMISAQFNPFERASILKALDYYNHNTCVSFEPRTYRDKDWVEIRGDRTGCWSSVGRVGGRQIMNLQPPHCLKKPGTAMHEALHVLGVQHEHTRYDRDEYINIRWDNIVPDKRKNFRKVDEESNSNFGFTYDFDSVMHYSTVAFSRNGAPTIIPKVRHNRGNIGQREGPSVGDVEKVRAMYNCDNYNELSQEKNSEGDSYYGTDWSGGVDYSDSNDWEGTLILLPQKSKSKH